MHRRANHQAGAGTGTQVGNHQNQHSNTTNENSSNHHPIAIASGGDHASDVDEDINHKGNAGSPTAVSKMKRRRKGLGKLRRTGSIDWYLLEEYFLYTVQAVCVVINLYCFYVLIKDKFFSEYELKMTKSQS